MKEIIIQTAIISLFPLCAIQINRRFKNLSVVSPIVLCFAFGIAVTNFQIISYNDLVSSYFRDASILIALPLLLMSCNLKKWKTDSKSMMLAFSIAVTSGIAATILSALIFQNQIESIWLASGMMVGINSGGTPNLFAVGTALAANGDIILITNSAQIFSGAVYLLFLLSFGSTFFSKFLKSGKREESYLTFEEFVNYQNIRSFDIIKALGLVLVIISLSITGSLLFFDSISPTFVIIAATTLAIISSLNRNVNQWKGTFEVGDYLLLMFGVAVGMSSNFEELLLNGKPYISFVISIFLFTILIHLLLSKLFRIDKNRHIIASTAAIYGPVFIPQVVQTLQDRSLLLAGIASSLIGLAIGNYLGISVAYLLEFILS